MAEHVNCQFIDREVEESEVLELKRLFRLYTVFGDHIISLQTHSIRARERLIQRFQAIDRYRMMSTKWSNMNPDLVIDLSESVGGVEENDILETVFCAYSSYIALSRWGLLLSGERKIDQGKATMILKLDGLSGNKADEIWPVKLAGEYPRIYPTLCDGRSIELDSVPLKAIENLPRDLPGATEALLSAVRYHKDKLVERYQLVNLCADLANIMINGWKARNDRLEQSIH